jgi:3-oxoacyl-[acyl-carrier protein] reductase
VVGRLLGKVAIITGASRGIGKTTAKLFADEGATVIVNYTHSETKARETLDEINQAHGGAAILWKADVSKEKEAKGMVAGVVEKFGRIDILVNNAGVLRLAAYDRINDKELDEMMGINLRGTLYCSQEAAKSMVPRRYGKIVNIASNAGLGTALVGTTAYAALKAGVIIFTKRFAFELGKSGVNVNCVAPGFIETDMTTTGRTAKEWEKVKDSMASRAALNRIGQPRDIANVILFLSSDESSFITGQTLVVDGGRMDYLSHSF